MATATQKAAPITERPEYLRERLKALPETPGVYLMRDAQGRVIAHSDDLNLFQRHFSSLPEVQAASVTGVVARDNNGREVLIAYAAVARPDWKVFVEMPAEEAGSLAQESQAIQ